MLKISKELVINWHITEACNYKCDYCFAKWTINSKEILHSEFKIEALLEQVSNIQKLLNEKSTTILFNTLRLNLVGGETFLYRNRLEKIINLSKKHNFKISAITNGSLFDAENIELIAKNFSSIGISVDSLNEKTNLIIGRTSKHHVFSPNSVLTAINRIREHSPNIEIKINTVVNKINFTEDLSDFIAKAQPNKWKVFKLLPVYSDKLEIIDEEFHQFLKKHAKFESIISPENNDDMTESYLMIDPLGRFFQNGLADGYDYSSPLWETSAEVALQQIKFDSQKFINRYDRIV